MARYRYNKESGQIYEVGDPVHDPRVHIINDNADPEHKGYLWHPAFDEHEQHKAYFSSKSKFRAETKARGFEERGTGRNPDKERQIRDNDRAVQSAVKEIIIQRVKALNLRNP
jgi:hypothetical protein